LFGVNDREDRVPGARKLPSSDLERRDSAIAGCAYHCLVQVALCEGECRTRTFQFGLDRFGARDPLASLCSLQPRLLERNLRGALGGAGLINLLGGDKTAPE